MVARYQGERSGMLRLGVSARIRGDYLGGKGVGGLSFGGGGGERVGHPCVISIK